MIWQLNPLDVKLRDRKLSRRDIKRQKERLLTEGQIEPILLQEDGYVDLDSWVYAEEQIVAARELDWPNILVSIEDDND